MKFLLKNAFIVAGILTAVSLLSANMVSWWFYNQPKTSSMLTK